MTNPDVLAVLPKLSQTWQEVVTHFKQETANYSRRLCNWTKRRTWTYCDLFERQQSGQSVISPLARRQALWRSSLKKKRLAAELGETSEPDAPGSNNKNPLLLHTSAYWPWPIRNSEFGYLVNNYLASRTISLMLSPNSPYLLPYSDPDNLRTQSTDLRKDLGWTKWAWLFQHRPQHSSANNTSSEMDRLIP